MNYSALTRRSKQLHLQLRLTLPFRVVTVLLIKLATSSAKRKALSVVKAVSYKAHYWICVQAVYTLNRHCVNSYIMWFFTRHLVSRAFVCFSPTLQFGRNHYTILRPFKEIQKLYDTLCASHGGFCKYPLPITCSYLSLTLFSFLFLFLILLLLYVFVPLSCLRPPSLPVTPLFSLLPLSPISSPPSPSPPLTSPLPSFPLLPVLLTRLEEEGSRALTELPGAQMGPSIPSHCIHHHTVLSGVQYGQVLHLDNFLEGKADI